MRLLRTIVLVLPAFGILACSAASEKAGVDHQADVSDVGSMTACPARGDAQCPAGSFAVTCADQSKEVDTLLQVENGQVCLPRVVNDPFDPASCTGAIMSLERAASFFSPGATSAKLGNYIISMRVRTCTHATGCTNWQPYAGDYQRGFEEWTSAAMLTGTASLQALGNDFRFGVAAKGECDTGNIVGSQMTLGNDGVIGQQPDGSPITNTLWPYEAGHTVSYPGRTCDRTTLTMGSNFFNNGDILFSGNVTDQCARFTAYTSSEDSYWDQDPQPWQEWEAAFVLRY